MNKNIWIKRTVAIFLILFVCVQILLPINVKALAEELIVIQFEDINMYNGIVSKLGTKISEKDDTNKTIKMTQTQIDTVTELTITNREIEKISGIEKFNKLEKLNLLYNKINDVEPLKNLTNLKILYLWSNQISNIEPLKDLINLNELDLGKNQIRNIDAIKQLTNLRGLCLGGNKLKGNIDELKNLTNLRYLYLVGNEIDNIDGIANLTNLDELYLAQNSISNIKVIEDQIEILENDKFSINLQNIEMEASSGTVKLPDIFIYAKDSKSKLYTTEEFSLENCKISENGTDIIFEDITKEATITIKGGKLANSQLIINYVEPKDEEQENLNPEEPKEPPTEEKGEQLEQDTTISNDPLPNAGIETILTLIILTIAVAIILIIKYKQMKDIK